jgi:hypothetical protein
MVVDGEAPRADHGDGPDGVVEDLPSLLKQLPSAHWFLLADVGKS